MTARPEKWLIVNFFKLMYYVCIVVPGKAGITGITGITGDWADWFTGVPHFTGITPMVVASR